MPTTATKIEDAVAILVAWELAHDVHGLTVACSNHEEFMALPLAVEYDGRAYGKSAWDSDKFRAYYRTDRMIARVHSRDLAAVRQSARRNDRIRRHA